MPGRFILGFEPGNILKLLVAMLHGAFLLGFAPPVPVLFQQLAHYALAHLNVMAFPQGGDDLLQTQVRPAHRLVHRIPRRVIIQHVQERLIDPGPLGLIIFPSSPLLPNAHFHFPSRQTTDFTGSFADRAPTAAQHAGDVPPAAKPQLQRFDTRIVATALFIQAVIQPLHRGCHFGIIGLHVKGLLAGNHAEMRGDCTGPEGYRIFLPRQLSTPRNGNWLALELYWTLNKLIFRVKGVCPHER